MSADTQKQAPESWVASGKGGPKKESQNQSLRRETFCRPHKSNMRSKTLELKRCHLMSRAPYLDVETVL